MIASAQHVVDADERLFQAIVAEKLRSASAGRVSWANHWSIVGQKMEERKERKEMREMEETTARLT
ncbi:MAG: hypothetical protein KDH89_15580 [Anaerolineae bacterium]|nr:hypothetical protein [Anaerolineae bacterium]